MKLLFLGDSITEGVGASSMENNYVSQVGKSLNCEVVNYGVSGTRIGRQTFIYESSLWNYDFRLRAEIMTEDADRVFVFGGTNDYGHGRLVLGEVGERIPHTFCYELRLLIEALCLPAALTRTAPAARAKTAMRRERPWPRTWTPSGASRPNIS